MIKEDLFNIQRLCFKYGKINLADWAAQSLEAYCIDQKSFYPRLESLHWWDNLYDLCGLRLSDPENSMPKAEAEKDNRLLRQSVMSICHEMAKKGYENPKIGRMLETLGPMRRRK